MDDNGANAQEAASRDRELGSGHEPSEPLTVPGAAGTNPDTPTVTSLTSLAPNYNAAQHRTYLDLLEDAVKDPRNRNIALSGRYGTGKSSVLDKFEEGHKQKTLRLAISTLAPDSEGATLTNRIQKEVLKQLIYSAKARTLRHSRFSRRGPMSWWRAGTEAAIFMAVVAALLALLGHLPSSGAAGPDHSLVQRILVWAALAILVGSLVAVLRMVTYNRFVISNVSAAGATLSLTASTNTYFDEYLDEIVFFFDQEEKDFVIFEDIDRYDDPQIFQALRELNTLLNNTPKRLKRIQNDKKPLRFIYAMRDSLFEKLGEDTAKERSDAARAETIRANRTKFFEVVIPVVPFISHRTAREHLHQLLRAADIRDIDSQLIELVARSATDMRLLLNMRNEYLVFAERLLSGSRIAPALSPSHLFALVAYKNFHLGDFEDISRRSSRLDRLYDYQRDLVAASVSARENSKRQLMAGSARPPALRPFAQRMGRRLVAFAKLERDLRSQPSYQVGFRIGTTRYDEADATSLRFWDELVEAGELTLMTRPGPQNNYSAFLSLTQEHLEGLFPDVLEGRWKERNDEEVHRRLEKLNREIEYLRGADFQDLANNDDFTLTIPASAPGTSESDEDSDDEDLTFGELVNRSLDSELACELVRQGYIDQNFTLYAAQFYGDFRGVDVATFVIQTVQTNSMDINYRFTSPAAFENLLAETDSDFTQTISAYNVQLVDFLLSEDVTRADQVVRHLTTHRGDHAERFLSAYFTSGAQRSKLAARLSRRPWPDVFTYVVLDDGVPVDVRPELVDAALRAADPEATYNLPSDVGDFVVEHFLEMSAFTDELTEDELPIVVNLLRKAKVSLPSLRGLHERIQASIVKQWLYELTADNLRTALSINGAVSLDQAQARGEVYEYCLNNLEAYLDAIDGDDVTPFSIESSQTLIDSLQALDPEVDDDALNRLTVAASRESELEDLQEAPTHTWPALAAAGLFRASLRNLAAYRSEVGEIDVSLGALLVEAGTIHLDDRDGADPDPAKDDDTDLDVMGEAVAVLNAAQSIPSPADRVGLVCTLELEPPFAVAAINAEASDLFARLIESSLVPDDAATFAHLRTAGWDALRPAILASDGIVDFVSPELIDGMVARILSDPATSSKVGRQIVGSLAQYVPTDDATTLAASGTFAVQAQLAMPVDQIRRITTAVKDPGITLPLLQHSGIDPTQVVSVLHELGGKYGFLTTWEEHEFEVPLDDAHKVVFEALKVANLAKVTKKNRKPFLVIKRP